MAELHKQRATVVSAVSIGHVLQKTVSDSVQKVLGSDAEVVFMVDKSLLGGIKILAGDTKFDSSLKAQLEHMTRYIINE